MYSIFKDTQKMYELLNALVGDDMVNFPLQALEGCKCLIYIKHAKNKMSKDPNAKYADYNYEDGPREENVATAAANLEKLQAA